VYLRVFRRPCVGGGGGLLFVVPLGRGYVCMYVCKGICMWKFKRWG
jgi:hypothetical protein